MTRALYLIGPPASGKSTVMAETLNLMGLVTGDPYQPWPVKNTEFRAEPLLDIIDGRQRGVSLGVTRPGGFPGTDAIGMASQPDAVGWVTESDQLPPIIVGEGMRLATYGFLAPLAVRTRLLVMYLNAPDEVLDARCEARGSNQKPQFRKTGATRARNLAGQLRGHGVLVQDCPTEVMSVQEIAAEAAFHLA